MKKNRFFEELTRISESHHVIFHPDAAREAMKLINKSGNEKRFIRQFATRLDELTENGIKAIESKNFEKPSKAIDIFSMKFDTSEYNFRFLFAFDSQGEIILCCFIEEFGKNTTSYQRFLPIAKKRLKEMKED